MTVINFGFYNETWSYEQHDKHTCIYDGDFDVVMILPWVAMEREVRAAAEGYANGMRIGKEIGSSNKVREIRGALGIGG